MKLSFEVHKIKKKGTNLFDSKVNGRNKKET